MKKLALLVMILGACVDTRDSIKGTQSLRVELKTPAGNLENRLPDTARMVTIDVTALDSENQVDTSFNNPVQVYVNFLGTLTPYLGAQPTLATLQMNAGVASNVSVMLPPVYGPATLFLDDGGAENPTYAVGASPTIWFRDPHVRDTQMPANEMALDALSKSPLESKQVRVTESRHGANGRLVVTSVFAQGYTVSDVQCGAGGAPPCTTGDYDHMLVFSFSAPRDEEGRLVREGQVIAGFAGGVSEFNGLTEMSFPQTFVEGEMDINPARMPAPATFSSTWFTDKFNFERNEAAPIAVMGAKVCDLDEDYDTYKQWKLDPTGMGGDCQGNRNVLNVITNGIVPDDTVRTMIEGRTLPRVVGVLRPVNIGSFNVWIIYPRSMADLTLQ